jgi:hypothetical protein
VHSVFKRNYFLQNKRAVSLDALIPQMQMKIFGNRPGELTALQAGGKMYLIATAERPELPLEKAARSDTRERLAAPFFGLSLAATSKGGIFPSNVSYTVKSVVRGSPAEEAGLATGDPVSIHSFKLNKDKGYALMSLSVQTRKSGFMEAGLQLASALDSPDTF